MPERLEKSNYLGSKRRLAKFIVDRFPEGVKTLSDPMCGVSAVLIEAARRGMRVKGNDLSVVPYWYSKGVFEGAPLPEGDVEKLVGAAAHDGWLTTEWKGEYPRPKAVRRYLDGLARLARGWSGSKGWAAKAVVSAVLQTLYSESGSGYSTIRYEEIEKVRAVVRRAAKEVSAFAAEVGGKGTITNVDAKAFSFPRADIVYFDPPYFKRDKGAVHYFQSYRIMNSVLLGKAWKEQNLSPDDIPAILEKLCRSARHVFVSTSSNEVVPYAKEIARHKKTMKRFRVSYRQTSGFGSRDEEQHQNLYAAKAAGSELTKGGPAKSETAGDAEDAKATKAKTPPEDGTYRYVIQHHFRGRSVHADLRVETGTGKLAGWTLNTQFAGSVREPVSTVEEARELTGYSKVDWEAGRVLDPVAAERKGDCDASWLDFEGVIEAGEAGALAEHPGVVVIIDRGVCEYGARREGYEEYFLRSEHPSGGTTGRVVFSQLNGGHKDIWLFSLPEDDVPYVLSGQAVKAGWVPPQGYSALPRGLRDDVPEERRYWVHADEGKRRKVRDALVAALTSRELELSGLRKDAGESSEDDFEKRKLIPFNQWGSSAKYAKRLAAKLPEHARYVEPFSGAAAVLFAKTRADEEVLADADADVVFALKYIKRLTPPRFEALKRFNWTVSRAGFKRARECKPESEHERFWKIVFRRLCAWGGIPWSTGFSTIHDGQTYPLDGLWRFHDRLKGVRVVRQDWKQTLKQCDGKDTLFFIDPPYIKEWGRGEGIPPEEIAEEVKRLKGRFVIAYTDSARARRALAKVGKLFTMRMLEARHRGLWAKRSRLFAASFSNKNGDKKSVPEDIDEVIRKSEPPELPVPFECAVDITKSYEEDGTWIVEGYAATSDFDLQEDIITEEAIRASAKDLIENSTVLHNHNPDEAIGKVLDSRARKDGLFLKILISKTAPEIWQQITEGVLNKFSVRGKVLQARKQWVSELKRNARLILKMKLLEVSLVAVPANPKARAIRWYIEKALDEFEKAGGEIEDSKGGPEMGEENVVGGELLVAEGDPADAGKRKGGEADKSKGFPSPDELDEQWSAVMEKTGLEGKGEAEVFKAWVEFCKEQGYPHPYPYPYPLPAASRGFAAQAGKPQSGVRMRQIVELVDRLVADEKDEARKKLLDNIRSIAAGAANAGPTPPAQKQGDGEGAEPPPLTNGEAGQVEKAGRKIAGARLARLKKLLKELEGLITEVDPTSPAKKKAGTVGDSSDKVAGIEGVVGKIAKALGMAEAKDGEDVPDLAGAVKDLRKRLDDLENTPGSKTSLDDEDGPGEGNKDEGSVWKGLL